MGFGIKTRAKKVGSSLKYVYDSAKIKENKYLKALLLCHALEKGMGAPVVKRGFGQEKAKKLIDNLKELHHQGDTECYEYREALAILKAYFAFQEKDGIDLSALKKEALEILGDDSSPYSGGFRLLSEKDFLTGKKIDFDSFVHSRHSMRTYSDAEITDEEMNTAISLAKCAPSACNREPWKFYYSNNRDISKKIGESLPSQSFIQDIPYIGIITVDRSLFNALELNQWFVNGGIFASFLILSFHSLGIGSCTFQYPLFSKSKESLREILGIPESEEIICGVGFGKYPKEAKCIYAERRSNDSILMNVLPHCK